MLDAASDYIAIHLPVLKAHKLIALCPDRIERGRILSERFGISLIDASDLSESKPRDIERFIRAQFDASQTESQYIFLLNDDGLSLSHIAANAFLSIRADFHGGTVRYRRQKGGGKGQMIAKAVGLGNGSIPRVLDATAGLGRDAFVLASLGCPVTMIERVPEVHVLLADALAQAVEWGATNDPELVNILQRMQLVESHALPYMRSLNPDDAPDVIYLDPMFPPRNKSAQVKKEMRVFHDLVGTDPDAAELLPAALQCAKNRVVVKRPRLSPTLDATKPSHTLDGKSNRFDVYVC